MTPDDAPMSTSDLIALLSSFAAIASAVGGAFAARAAARSARSAEQTLAQADRGERRLLTREIRAVWRSIDIGVKQTDSELAWLKLNVDTAAAQQGAFHGSTHAEWLAKIEELKGRLEPFRKTVSEGFGGHSALLNASNDDLSNRLSELNSVLAGVDASRSMIEQFVKQFRG